jgi:hypothetical protein
VRRHCDFNVDRVVSQVRLNDGEISAGVTQYVAVGVAGAVCAW